MSLTILFWPEKINLILSYVGEKGGEKFSFANYSPIANASYDPVINIILVHRCGASGSMRACHAAGPGSIPGRDKFPGWGFSRGFSSPVRQTSGSFRPPRSPNIIWPSLSSIIIHYGRHNDLRCWRALKPEIYIHTWSQLLQRVQTGNYFTLLVVSWQHTTLFAQSWTNNSLQDESEEDHRALVGLPDHQT